MGDAGKGEVKAVKGKKKPSERKCPHCKGSILMRNPTGKCDHLYYPECCKVCFTREYLKAKRSLMQRREAKKGKVVGMYPPFTPLKYKRLKETMVDAAKRYRRD